MKYLVDILIFRGLKHLSHDLPSFKFKTFLILKSPTTIYIFLFSWQKICYATLAASFALRDAMIFGFNWLMFFFFSCLVLICKKTSPRPGLEPIEKIYSGDLDIKNLWRAKRVFLNPIPQDPCMVYLPTFVWFLW